MIVRFRLIRQLALIVSIVLASAEAYDASAQTIKREDIIERDFIVALAALEQGQIELAIAQLSALAKETHAPRIRLELARALTFVGKDEDARALFIGVYEDNPPPDVKATILNFIDDIDLRRGKLSFGLRGERASNPLSEPTSSVFQFAGQTLTSASEPRYQNSFGVVYFARYEKQLSPLFDLRSAASFRDLPGTSGDLASGDVSIGYRLAETPLELRGGVEFARMTDRSFTMPYVETSYRVSLSDRLAVQPRLQKGDMQHEAGFGPSGQNYRFSVPAIYALSPARKLITGPQTEFRRVGFEELSYHSLGWTFEADFNFPLFSIATTIFPSVTEFEAVDPFWDVRRRDEGLRGSIELSSDRIRYGGIKPTLNFSCDRTRSTIDYYTSDNCAVGLGMQKIF